MINEELPCQISKLTRRFPSSLVEQNCQSFVAPSSKSSIKPSLEKSRNSSFVPLYESMEGSNIEINSLCFNCIELVCVP